MDGHSSRGRKSFENISNAVNLVLRDIPEHVIRLLKLAGIQRFQDWDFIDEKCLHDIVEEVRNGSFGGRADFSVKAERVRYLGSNVKRSEFDFTLIDKRRLMLLATATREQKTNIKNEKRQVHDQVDKLLSSKRRKRILSETMSITTTNSTNEEATDHDTEYEEDDMENESLYEAGSVKQRPVKRRRVGNKIVIVDVTGNYSEDTVSDDKEKESMESVLRTTILERANKIWIGTDGTDSGKFLTNEHVEVHFNEEINCYKVSTSCLFCGASIYWGGKPNHPSVSNYKRHITGHILKDSKGRKAVSNNQPMPQELSAKKDATIQTYAETVIKEEVIDMSMIDNSAEVMTGTVKIEQDPDVIFMQNKIVNFHKICGWSDEKPIIRFVKSRKYHKYGKNQVKRFFLVQCFKCDQNISLMAYPNQYGYNTRPLTNYFDHVKRRHADLMSKDPLYQKVLND